VGCEKNDQRVVDDVKSRIAEVPHTAALQVSADNGIVKLEGFASSEGEKRRIEDAARSARGVIAVDNELRIRQAPTLTGAPAK
jgi:osmotically-inducible protein OsmY